MFSTLSAFSDLAQDDIVPERLPASAKSIYFDLLDDRRSDRKALARGYLDEQLRVAKQLDCDLPGDPRDLAAWLAGGAERVGEQYQAYLRERREGAQRRYFPTRSAALYFLRAIAPTKTVDGAWLYGLVERWNDARYAGLIRIYLEELGEGFAERNHVALYHRLLAAHGSNDWGDLADEFFVQGAIQLALAHDAEHFLPEVIGFNLGYEQLPLHLLVTAYELNELGIDPRYFTLHVTVDNAATGHARKSLDALFDALPRVADAGDFYRRVVDGFKLNLVGAGSVSIVEGFDLQQEVVAILDAKSTVGKMLHSDYCRIGGRTVNDWLSNPANIPAFLESMQRGGMIKRHQDPGASRFWKLIAGDRAEMFGVFTAYEQQVIHDWIAGDSLLAGDAARDMKIESPRDPRAAPPRKALSFRARRRLHESLSAPSSANLPNLKLPDDLLLDESGADFRETGGELDADVRRLEQRLACAAGKDDAMRMLASLMAPGHHHVEPGLTATRIFTRMLAQA